MEIKERFLTFLETERRLSPNTVETYSESLKLFGNYIEALQDARDLLTADADNIRDWMESMMECGRSAAYVNRSLAALRTFYRYCLTHGVVDKDPAHGLVGPKKEKRLPQFVREREMDRLLEYLNSEDGGYDVICTRTIIYTLYLTGLRAAELISLDVDDVNFVNKEMKVTGKRNKQRIIPFGEELHNVLISYLESRGSVCGHDEKALFVSAKGQRLGYPQVLRMVKAALNMVDGVEKRSPHVLRHTFATTMLNNNANLESIKKLLGHQSLDTTEIYTHTTFEQLRQIYNDAHPRNNP